MPSATESGGVVATVNGKSIGADTVERYARRNGVSAEVALDALIAAELLAAKISPEELESKEAHLAYKRFSVQMLLVREIEDKITPQSLTKAELQARYTRDLHLYKRPDTRRTTHILIMPTGDPKRSKAETERLLELARKEGRKMKKYMEETKWSPKEGKDFQDFATAYRSKLPEGLVAHVDQNMVAAHRQFRNPGQPGFIPPMVNAFADGLFATPPNQLSAPIDTIFGTHVLMVHEVIPGFETPLAKVESKLRKEVAADKRREVYLAWSEKLVAKSITLADMSALERLGTDSK